MNQKTPILLSYAFRPFFLLNGMFAVLIMLAWILALHGTGLAFITPLWHGHEMLIGFALAAVTGFSLTAVANWTGRPTLKGAPLGWLVLSWLVGRLAMMLSGWMPPVLTAFVDMLFPVLLCLLLSREIIVGRSRRNYPLLVIAVAFILLNGLYHLGVNQWVSGADRIAVYLLIHTILVLVTIISGRIVPSFTANWLRAQGHTRLPVNHLAVDRLALWMTVLVGLMVSFFPLHSLTGWLAFIAALVHAYRLSHWHAFTTISNPLLFVLHVAYAWLPVGYTLLGCAVFGWLFTPTSALHALTMGAIGSTVLAVMTRVALGHTGRPLQAARATVMAYWILMLTVLSRVLESVSGADPMLMMDISAIGWMMAFAIFIWVYWPILTRAK